MSQAPLHTRFFCSLFPDELLALSVEETNRCYDQTVAALGGLDTSYSLAGLDARLFALHEGIFGHFVSDGC